LILSATSTVAVGDFNQANAICFSPHENQLFISDASGSPSNRVFVVGDDGTLTNGPEGGRGRHFVVCRRLGAEPPVGRVVLPEVAANLASAAMRTIAAGGASRAARHSMRFMSGHAALACRRWVAPKDSMQRTCKWGKCPRLGA